MMRGLFTALLILLLITPSYANEQVTLLCPSGLAKPNQDYLRQLLSAALKATAKNPNAVTINEKIVLGGYEVRTKALQDNSVDVAYFLASKNAEQLVTPIRIPLYKGLMGYRTLIINANKQDRFEKIHSLAQLKTLTKATQKNWITTRVINHYGFHHIKTPTLYKTFKSLSLEKADYSTRGVIETPHTLALITKTFPTLKIEDHLLFYFELPMYFYVANHNQALAKRLKQGLMKIIENGQFEQLFAQIYQKLPANLNLPDRRTIYLENPYQSVATRQNVRTFWPYQIKKPPF